MRFFRKKFSFSRPKFLMTFFSHRPGFSDFALFTVIKCHIRPFLHKKNHYFLDKTIFFTLFILSRASDNTTCLNIGGTNAWAVPHLKFLGRPSPQVSAPGGEEGSQWLTPPWEGLIQAGRIYVYIYIYIY